MDDAPDYRLLSEKRVKARKDYVCVYCKEPLRKGRLYTRIAFLEDGKFFFERMHAHNPQYCPQNMER